MTSPRTTAILELPQPDAVKESSVVIVDHFIDTMYQYL